MQTQTKERTAVNAQEDGWMLEVEAENVDMWKNRIAS